MRWIKDPDATLDYSLDFTEWLEADTLASATWSAPGLTVVSSSTTTTTATIWLSGGTVGQVYPVRCRVVTAGGRTDDRTFELAVTHR
jgi:hypothetical protein